jgi:hypothetical protein
VALKNLRQTPDPDGGDLVFNLQGLFVRAVRVMPLKGGYRISQYGESVLAGRRVRFPGEGGRQLVAGGRFRRPLRQERQDPSALAARQAAEEVVERLGRGVVVGEIGLPERGIAPNVDFFSGSVYDQLGIPVDLYTPIFAMSRVGGWVGHVLEYQADNRLIRPRARYTGPENEDWVPIDRR